jgi:sugar phosphate isomerase/epimerase
MVHASDNLGKGDDHLPPGKGTIDWDGLLAHLARIEFAGTLILELSGRQPQSEVLAEAQQARRFLREIVRRQ